MPVDNGAASSNMACTMWRAALRRLGLVLRAEGGVAALEFALFAPFLFVSLLTMVDIGFALHERMTIDHILRAGAQTAMQGGDDAAVLKVLKNTAAGDEALTLTVTEKYFCNEGGVMVEVSDVMSPCSSATSIFLELKGTKTYDPIFPPMEMTLEPSIEVQLR